MRVGLTFFAHSDPERSIWSSGATQQCVFLVQCLRAAGHELVPVNAGYAGVRPGPRLMLAGLGLDWEDISDELVDSLDVLIEAEGQVSAEHVARVRRRGGRAIAYRFGNAYVIDAERAIHGKPTGSIFNGAAFDEVWTNPQHERTCRAYWEVTYRCPVRVLPHLWSPVFVERAARELEAAGKARWGEPRRRGPWRVAVLEPNLNILKTCHVPLLACEVVHRGAPDAIECVFVTNAEHLKGHETFERFVTSLDVWRDGRTSFSGRNATPWLLATYADIVVAHQWENGLNFAYYEAAYGGYPLVHNSELIPWGWRYKGFDVWGAARALRAALDATPEERSAYVTDARGWVARLAPDRPSNCDAYSETLGALAKAA